MMQWEQKPSRGVSGAPRPIAVLNHCRFASIRVSEAIDVCAMKHASCVRSSKACSGGVSRMS